MTFFALREQKKESFYHELPDMLYFLWMKRDTKNYKCKWKRRKHVLVSRLKFQELDNEHKRKISNEMQETWNYFEIIFFSFTRSVNSLLLSVRARNAVRNVKKTLSWITSIRAKLRTRLLIIPPHKLTIVCCVGRSSKKSV